MVLRYVISPVFTVILLIATLSCHQRTHFADNDTDYDAELATIEHNITESAAKSSDAESAIQHINYLYQRASLTGDFEQFRKVETELDSAQKQFGESAALMTLRANLHFKLHKLDSAEQLNRSVAAKGFNRQAKTLQADIALQRGQYSAAISAYSTIVRDDPNWQNQARLAYYYGNTGNVAKAAELYHQAQEQLSAKDMRQFAWLELQQGLLELHQKNYRQALNHYLVAENSYSGYWLIREHIAEVYGLLGKTEEAIDLYEKIITKTNNPEFVAALATLVRKSDSVKAAALDKKADELFNRNYALYPEAALGHFITYLLERDEIDERLLPFALRNHELRPNAEAKILLIKALLKSGDVTGARNYLKQLLQTPWRDPEIEALTTEIKSRE